MFYDVIKKSLLVMGLMSALNANSCPKWLPMPMTDGLHAVIPIYDESITGPDMDCDEILDAVDSDIDGDGLSNAQEAALGTDPYNPNTDGDTASDGNDAFPLDPTESTDTDGDGTGNNADTDDDNDGVLDINDAFPLDAAETTDTDGDGIGNNADPDDDNDGVSDADETAAGSDPLDANSIAHGGVAYGVVTSPYTGHKWLDRNLGASRVCTSFDDAQCYEDYYQWGRAADGHEKSNSATTSTQANSVPVNDAKFIQGHYDWVTGFEHTYPEQRAYRWSQRDGSSVCPVGFRIPTINEFIAETINQDVTNRDTAFSNFLKLPSAGYRKFSNGDMLQVNTGGDMWTSSYIGNRAAIITFTDTSASYLGISDFAYGNSIRCMKPIVTTDNPPVVTLHGASIIEMIQFGSYPVIHVSAVDDVDGVLVPNVVVTDSHGQSFGLLDVSVAGTYTMAYTATDSAGHVSNTVTATVIIHPAMKKTGQTKSYDENGDEVTDHSLKDDGYYQKGHDPLYVRDAGDEIVTDNITGLQWQDDNDAKTVQKQWLTDANYDICTGSNGATQDTSKCTDTSGDTAATYCSTLVLGGHSDWRLPTRKELVGLADYGQVSPAMKPVFQNVASTYYWSSTTVKNFSDFAWLVAFGDGHVRYSAKDSALHVRCVRAGQ